MQANGVIVLPPFGDDVKTGIEKAIVGGTRLTCILCIRLSVYRIELLRQRILKCREFRLAFTGKGYPKRMNRRLLIAAVKSAGVDAPDQVPEFGVTHMASPSNY